MPNNGNPVQNQKPNQPSAKQRNDWNLKTLKLAKPMSQKNNATAPSEIAPNQQTGEPDGIN